MKTTLVTLGCVLALAGCASTLELQDQDNNNLVQTNKPIYTLINLHPDATRLKLYSLNYQQGGFIPRCTKVDLLSATNKVMKFTIEETGQTYSYYWHKRTPNFAQNIKRYFGTTCPTLSKKFNKIDKQGIASGKVLEGMSKEAVIQAIGYPPVFRTPKPMSTQNWIYWTNRWKTMKVTFDAKGKVSNDSRL